jgi:predicted hydrocarbon binding protein
LTSLSVEEKGFWRDIVSTIAFFSPAINPLQREFAISSKDLLRRLGEEMGRQASESIQLADPVEVFNYLSEMWRRLVLGRLEIVSRDPLTIKISDCSICGQLPGLGRVFECSFHEGFFKGLLSHRLKRDVRVWQEVGIAGESGTWTRILKTDASL